MTLHDVARAAGVSKSTVSNVVRGGEAVSPSTRERVMQAVSDLGYRPNAVARSLRARSTMVLGLIVTEQLNPFYAQLARGVESTARVAGYGLLVANTDALPDLEQAQVDALVDRRVDGVVVGGMTVDSDLPDRLIENGIRVVLAGCGTARDLRVGVVDVDDAAAMTDVVAHLAELGHRRVGFAPHERREAAGERRAIAFHEAARERGLEVCSLDDDPTAIVAHNDLVAIELIDRLERRGIRVPRDVSVVGFDDVPAAAHCRIELTTVRCDGAEIGERAALTLLDAIDDKSHVARVELLQPRLVVRGSTDRATTALRRPR